MFIFFFRENKNCHYMWIICYTDNSQALFSLEKKNLTRTNVFKISSAEMIGILGIKLTVYVPGKKVVFFFSFCGQ